VIEVRPARDESEVQAALALREEVFCGEQGVSLADERDGRDGEALHLVAVEDGAVLGTCRLLVEGTTVKLGRMAVARAARARGLGRALLDDADVRARALGGERVALAAQLTARGMYERAGYEAYGDVFLDAGIEHVMMARALR
jgi:predicted GNAT family N-acyltransferase